MIRKAPAKINLRLEILGRRADGYHLLQSVMVPVTVADELSFESRPVGISFTCADKTLPTGDGNLDVRAAKSLFAECNYSGGVKIHLKKCIPAAAGLGGGSSDAATTLLGLRDLLKLKVAPDRLHALAAELGADVPFFLAGRACVARGVGEQIEPYDVVKNLPLALVKPPEGLSTPSVYKALDWPLTRQVEPHKLPPSLADLESVCVWLRNDLEGPAERLLPQIGECKKLLRSEGAAAVQMSGSGPTVFGIFNSSQEAVRACESAERRGWWACPCLTD
jgi:4-diphosphocytidyl-2-C-methyl-D-erythritol kinase